MIQSASEPCADPERLAAFIDGSLPPQRRADVIHHVSRCAKCRSVVQTVAEGDDERDVWSRLRIGGAIAAGLVLVVAGYLFLRSTPWREDRLERLASTMPSSGRTIEPRFSHFPWAPLERVRRGASTPKSPVELMIGGAAGMTLREIDENGSPSALHAAGVAHMLQDDAAQGIAKLREAAARAPRNAAVWIDLSAALYCDAADRDDNAIFREARAAADRAIQLAPQRPEAYFNRALIDERIGTSAEAIAAWKAFLALDGQSGWASEARAHLQHASPKARL